MKKTLLLLGFISILLTACGNSSPYVTIEINEVTSYQDNGYIIVDVREQDEFAEGHIENSLNVPLSQLQNKKFDPLTKEKKYIIICRSGNRSQTASNILVENGFEIVNVDKGITSWPGTLE